MPTASRFSQFVFRWYFISSLFFCNEFCVFREEQEQLKDNNFHLFLEMVKQNHFSSLITLETGALFGRIKMSAAIQCMVL